MCEEVVKIHSNFINDLVSKVGTKIILVVVHSDAAGVDIRLPVLLITGKGTRRALSS